MSERIFDAIRRFVRELVRPLLLLGTFEYRVVDLVPPGSGFAQLQPVRPIQIPLFGLVNLPSVDRINMWSGAPGAEGDPQLGSSVLVGFINGDRNRPFVVGYEGVSTPGYKPTRTALDASSHVDVGASAGTVNVGQGAGATANVATGGYAHVGKVEAYNISTVTGRFIRSGDTVQLGSTSGVINIVGGMQSGAGS